MSFVAATGRRLLSMTQEAGGLALLFARAAQAPFSRRFEWRETLRQSGTFGVGSLVVLGVTSALVGGILVVQAGLQVNRFGVQELVGWFVGFGVLREVGPLVAGLTFSGRVGSRNAAEIAAMKTRDQLAGLESMGIDIVPTVVAPRAAAMSISLVTLYVLGAVISIITASAFAWMLLDVDPWQFGRSFTERTELADLWTGMTKTFAFSFAIATVSCRAGLGAHGGASAVGDAAKQAVVRAAFAIVVLDLIVSRWF